MRKFLFILISFFPLISYAQVYDFYSFIRNVFYPIISIIPGILLSLSFVAFVWGIVRYVLSNGEVDKKEARGIIVFGIIAITIIVGMWAIVAFIQRDFRIGGVLTPYPSEPLIDLIDLIE